MRRRHGPGRGVGRVRGFGREAGRDDPEVCGSCLVPYKTFTSDRPKRGSVEMSLVVLVPKVLGV